MALVDSFISWGSLFIGELHLRFICILVIPAFCLFLVENSIIDCACSSELL